MAIRRPSCRKRPLSPAAMCSMAKTSRDAFRILGDQMQRLEVVVVDVDPGAHGLALLEAISSCADRPPIVVITALEETYMEPIALKHGAAACLGKPITVQRLISTLKGCSTRSLTSDRWGCLVPSTASNEIDVNASFRGIAAKLSPVVSRRPSSSSVRKSANSPKEINL